MKAEPKAGRRIWTDEAGATAIEYALLCGIMAVALVAVASVGGALDQVYGKVSNIIGALGG